MTRTAYTVLVFFVALVHTHTLHAQTVDFDITRQLRERGVTVPDGVRGSLQDFNILGLTPNGEDPLVFLKSRAGNNDVTRLNPQFARCLATLMKAAEQKTGRTSKITNGPIGAYRHPSLQTALVAKGASKVGPGMSFHNCGTAADVTGPSNSMTDPIVKAMGAMGSMYGIENPISWDRWHFQAPNAPRPCNVPLGTAFKMNGRCDEHFTMNDAAYRDALAKQETLQGDWRQVVTPLESYQPQPYSSPGQSLPQFGQGTPQQPYQFTPNGTGSTSPTGSTGQQAGTQQPGQQLPVYGSQQQPTQQGTTATPLPTSDIFYESSKGVATKGDSKVEIIIKPKLAVAGSKVTLGWRGTNVQSCTMKGPQATSKKISGITSFTFSTSGTYVLTCTSDAGDILKARADIQQVTE